MNNTKKALLALASLTLMACAKNKGSGLDTPNDTLRSMSQGKVHFIPNKQEITLKSLSETDAYTMLSCKTASTIDRLDKESFSTIYRQVERHQGNFDYPLVSTTTEVGYKTETNGDLYNDIFELIGTEINGVQALTNATYKYVDTCTITKGCDIKKRDFSHGDTFQLVKAPARVSKAYKAAFENVDSVDCSYKSDEDAEKIDDVVLEGVVNLGSGNIDAVQVISKQHVKIICSGHEVSKGMKTSSQIVLKDLLPNTSGFNTSNLGALSIGCNRTSIFNGHEVTALGKVMTGSSTDLSFYMLTGEVLSLEEWEKNEEARQETRDELVRIVERMQDRFNRSNGDLKAAEADLATKQADLEAARVATETAKNEKLRIESDPLATESEKLLAREKHADAIRTEGLAQASLEASQKALKAAKADYDTAERNLSDAKARLERFEQKNRS